MKPRLCSRPLPDSCGETSIQCLWLFFSFALWRRGRKKKKKKRKGTRNPQKQGAGHWILVKTCNKSLVGILGAQVHSRSKDNLLLCHRQRHFAFHCTSGLLFGSCGLILCDLQSVWQTEGGWYSCASSVFITVISFLYFSDSFSFILLFIPEPLPFLSSMIAPGLWSTDVSPGSDRCKSTFLLVLSQPSKDQLYGQHRWHERSHTGPDPSEEPYWAWSFCLWRQCCTSVVCIDVGEKTRESSDGLELWKWTFIQRSRHRVCWLALIALLFLMTVRPLWIPTGIVNNLIQGPKRHGVCVGAQFIARWANKGWHRA